MRIFITGGTGFIGTRLVKLLLEKSSHELLLLVIEKEEVPVFSSEHTNRVTIIRGNLSNGEEWGKKLVDWKPEATIHLGWEGIPMYGPELSFHNYNNSLALFKLLTLTSCKKVIGAGSCWEYGTKVGELSELSPLVYRDAFTSAKTSSHLMGRAIAEHHGMKFIWARFFYVYGVGQKQTTLIPTIISAIKNGQKPNIKTPDSENDFVYVDDIASGLKVLVEKQEESGLFNIGTGTVTSIRSIISIIYTELKLKQEEFPKNPSAEEVSFYANFNKMKALGWSPKYTIKDGIIEMLKEQKMIK